MLSKLTLLFDTIRYLRPTQVYHQVLYRLKTPGNLASYMKVDRNVSVEWLSYLNQSPVLHTYLGENYFTFLNLKKEFEKEINWDFQDFGKLWNYNLQYGNFLLQEELSFQEKRNLMLSLYSWLEGGRLRLEPYPASLRIINGIRLLSQEQRRDDLLEAYINGELNFLSRRLEFHLLGNHLLENAFALLMGGAFFAKKDWIIKGEKLIQRELKEQILSDGAHFELSPMYHQIVFFRLLELIDWYKDFDQKKLEFEQELRRTAGKMRNWLERVSFRNGDIPHFNDSAPEIAYSTSWLISYSELLGIGQENFSLGASGYRSFTFAGFECKMDTGKVGPSYQPGHAHADTLQFALTFEGKPIVVDTGVSTYENNERRQVERGTAAHNTVTVNNINSSQVWGGFRLAKRAKVTIEKDEPECLVALHDGFRNVGVSHTREFSVEKESFVVQDHVFTTSEVLLEGHLHLHPSVRLEIRDTSVLINGSLMLDFNSIEEFKIEEYSFAKGFNLLEPSTKIIYNFKEKANLVFTPVR